MFSIFCYLINYFNVLHSNIEKYQLMLVAISIFINVIHEILILVRLFILLKNVKAVNRRDTVLILDIKKIDNYYLKIYKNIYIKEYSLPNNFMNINISKIKYIKKRENNLEHLN